MILDIFFFTCYNDISAKYHQFKTRGCTGFDGGCAAMEAIGGSRPPQQREQIINAEDNLAIAA